MNNEIISKTGPLVYNCVNIAAKAEMLSLTDMWKAAGSAANKDPAQWLRSATAEAFVEAVSVNMGISHNDIVKTQRGGKTPGTFSHWQVALAYAKYLSPEFHMWCNQVVRERMEGRAIANATALTERDREIIGNMIKNCTGVVLKEHIGSLMTSLLPSAVAGYVAEHHISIADGVTAGEVCDLAKVAAHYPRGLSGRVSRRLTQFCIRNGERPRVTRLGRVRAQLFPTHLVREWLDIEGRALIRTWISEKDGQGKLRLISGEGR